MLLPDTPADAPAPSDLVLRPAGPGDKRRIRRLYDDLDVRLSSLELRRLTEAGTAVVALTPAGRVVGLADGDEVAVAPDWRAAGVAAALRVPPSRGGLRRLLRRQRRASSSSTARALSGWSVNRASTPNPMN